MGLSLGWFGLDWFGRFCSSPRTQRPSPRARRTRFTLHHSHTCVQRPFKRRRCRRQLLGGVAASGHRFPRNKIKSPAVSSACGVAEMVVSISVTVNSGGSLLGVMHKCNTLPCSSSRMLSLPLSLSLSLSSPLPPSLSLAFPLAPADPVDRDAPRDFK